MKTPRDILLGRHRPIESKLDAIREGVVAQCREERRGAIPKMVVAGMAALPILLWRELILPSRRTWAGIAAAWVVILAVNFSLRDPVPPGNAAKMSAPEMMSFQEQQKLLNELLADRSLPVDGERPKTFSPGPRSERVYVVMT
jgi:hypothetical protein